jgi:uncharacterized membrane protein
MFFVEHFRIASEKNKIEAVARLVKAGTGDFHFYLFVVLGVAMATMGLLLDSATVVIGSMLIAPVLVPPLAAVGVGVALVEASVLLGAFQLLLLNVAGVAVASMIAFSLMDVHSAHKVAKSAVEQEEARIKKEEEKIQEVKEQHEKQKQLHTGDAN